MVNETSILQAHNWTFHTKTVRYGMVQVGQLPLSISRLTSNICISTQKPLRILQTCYDPEQMCDLTSDLMDFVESCVGALLVE